MVYDSAPVSSQDSVNANHRQMGHSSQIQQVSGINVLKYSSNFNHLFVSMKELFPENFTFTAQFSHTLAALSFRDCPEFLLAKIGRNAKIAKMSHFFRFLNLHHLLEMPYSHIKLCIFSCIKLCIFLQICLEITYLATAKYPEIFFDALKTGQNEKSYIFQEIGISEIHV